MICTVCQHDNDAGIKLCGRCGSEINRDIPPLLVLESLLTREVIWGLNAAGLILPLGLLGGGLLVAWIVWDSLGYTPTTTVVGFLVIAPGAIFTLSSLPVIRRVQSALVGLGAFTMIGLLAVPVAVVGLVWWSFF